MAKSFRRWLPLLVALVVGVVVLLTPFISFQ